MRECGHKNPRGQVCDLRLHHSGDIHTDTTTTPPTHWDGNGVRRVPCPGPSAPATFHWGPIAVCPECF